jgi:hypothetical protein
MQDEYFSITCCSNMMNRKLVLSFPTPLTTWQVLSQCIAGIMNCPVLPANDEVILTVAWHVEIKLVKKKKHIMSLK